MTNLKIERLGKALIDELTLRIGANSAVPLHDGNGDLYLTVTRGVGDAALVKFEPEAVEPSGSVDSLGLAQAVYTPHVTKLGIDAGAPGTRAAETVTLNAVVATNTLTINGVTFTAVAGAPGANQFQVGADDNATAANLATAINTSASAGIVGIVTALASTNTVTITAVVAGVLGNSIAVSGTAVRFTVPTATLQGGVNPTGALTSDVLRNLLVALCAPTGTALLIYEKAGIVLADLTDASLLTNTIRNNPWGILGQV